MRRQSTDNEVATADLVVLFLSTASMGANVRRIIVWACIALAAVGCCRRPAAGNQRYAAVALTDVARNPASFQGKLLILTGTLNNSGANYFAGLQLRLSDGAAAVPVLPWLPLEVPPPRPRTGGQQRPAVISDYLNKQVRLAGRLQKDSGTYAFAVSEATIIEEDQ